MTDARPRPEPPVSSAACTCPKRDDGSHIADLESDDCQRHGRIAAPSTDVQLLRDPDTGEMFDPYTDDFGNDLDCTRCGGEGTCDDNANPLWDCDDNPHPCHACGGSGSRRDQRVF